ncbi:matrix metalloproteinase-2-like [Bacillus rossius redtenbacheri]|uniref:matrix metalloproteinase-2-like n=1 Tax=Bacillus rossius redtenbacheri TaxID=93214 RepID=UPI002FDD3A15
MDGLRSLLLLLLLLLGAWSAPRVGGRPTLAPPRDVPPAEALAFMKQFGYLAAGAPDTEALYSEQAMQDAVRTMQRFGGLQETGKLDTDTLKLISAQRCGVPDVARSADRPRQKRYIVGSQGWRKRNVTYFVANWSPKIGEDAVVSELQRAFTAWSGYARLKFQQVTTPDADIIIAFGIGPHGDGYAFDGPGSILAHAFYPYEMGQYGGDMHFDEDEEWRIRPSESEEGVDFFTVAVHEMGHSLGLSHSTVSSSIMFPYYKGTQENFQLDYDDILGMYELYIANSVPGDDEANQDSDSGSTSGHESDDDNEVNPKSTTPRPTTTTTPSTTTTRSAEATVSYIGDDEDVDEHLSHAPTRHTPTASPVPDACKGDFDAVANLRGELFVFKDKYVWRLSQKGQVQPGYPVLIHHLFWKFPETVKRIDAAYQRPTDGNLIFFTGDHYWVFNGDNFVENSPQPLTNYGLPSHLTHIDAAMVWGKNGKTFFYTGDQYWRFNETTRTMDAGYPKNIAKWRGVPPSIDAAVTWTDGFTYFFKGSLFWRFDNYWIKTDKRYPLPAPQNWLGCPEKLDTVWW